MVSESVGSRKLIHIPPWLWWLKTTVFTLILAYAICLLLSPIVALAISWFFKHDLFIVFTRLLWLISSPILFVLMFYKLKKEPLQPLPEWYKATSLIVVLIYSLILPFVQSVLPGWHGLISLAILVPFCFLSFLLE